jgi:hypothetical protein
MDIRDRSGRIWGRLKDTGNKIIAEDYNGWRLGQFEKSTNTTSDVCGKIISNGDLTMLFFRDFPMTK